MQPLSSRTTVFWHYVLPALTIVGCVSTLTQLIDLALRHALTSIIAPEWFMIAMAPVLAMFAVWFARLIWTVRVADGSLLVTRYRQRIRVPVDAVDGVREDRVLGSPVTVAIHFRRDVDGVGRVLRFLPRPHWFRWHRREAAEISEILRQHGANLGISAHAV